jgi:ubiquitin-protein ligase
MDPVVVVEKEPIPVNTDLPGHTEHPVEEKKLEFQSEPEHIPSNPSESHSVSLISTETPSVVEKTEDPSTLDNEPAIHVAEEAKSLPEVIPEQPENPPIEEPSLQNIEIKETESKELHESKLEPLISSSSSVLEPSLELSVKNTEEKASEQDLLAISKLSLEENKTESISSTLIEHESEKNVEEIPAENLQEHEAGIEEQEINEEKEEVLPPPPQVLFREPSASDPEAPESTHHYFQNLGSLRLQMSDWGPEQLSNYIYDDSPLEQDGLSRIHKEIKALTRSLPCEPSGSVFVTFDSSNLSRVKALISGTEDTPYEHGLYLFDIKLDSNYPNAPPKMNIKTTGGGTLRFNPNLYDSGYVCLSIINTWGGDPEEMWNPSYSTLMQVFLSIQALVMNNDVIQKEPGYEHMETNCPENQDYVKIVRYGNIAYAMIDMLKNPPHEFKEIVVKHFTLKKEKILQTVEKWVEESKNIGDGFNDYILSCHNPTAISIFRQQGGFRVFSEKFEELKDELDKLPSL